MACRAAEQPEQIVVRPSGFGMPPPREISPAVNATVDEYLKTVGPRVKAIIAEVRRQKADSTRPRPSTVLVDSSSVLTPQHRAALLDTVAALVDENLSGRSDMCQQFADLVNRALTYLRFPSRPVLGWAMYFSSTGEELFRWRHAWVRVGDEVVDGNNDCLSENPRFPPTVVPTPYWGPFDQTPGRRLREERGASLPPDSDVADIWWPDLRGWLDADFLKL